MPALAAGMGFAVWPPPERLLFPLPPTCYSIGSVRGPGVMKRSGQIVLALVLLLSLPTAAAAGLHYSGERYNELPAQWRGLLNDLRLLRSIAQAPPATLPPSPLREDYQDRAAALLTAGHSRALTADELADLGAIYLRLGDTAKAVEILRPAADRHPEHFAIHANLGTAWQLQGELDHAAECLRQAVQLAPAKLKRGEEIHLRLVESRRRSQAAGVRGENQELDDLFGVRYVNEKGAFEPGKLAGAEREKLPADAVALVQQLALWLPSDGRLIWQLAELANAHGDVRIAGEMFEFCVSGLGMAARPLRAHRASVRRLLAEWDQKDPHGLESALLDHKGHAGAIAFKSRRPLPPRKLDPALLPAINKDAVNTLLWPILAETEIDSRFRATFPKHLKELDGLRVSLIGFIQPIGDDLDLSSFLLVEYPTGCWYCEMPDAAGMVLVELVEGATASYTRNIVKVTGELKLNMSDPEGFLFSIRDARVTAAD